jgi:RNA polymerase sigma factor (sigma-70 family)
MPEATDSDLLRDYSQRGSEQAFALLVERHINLVYSAAMRHVGVSAHAEEIAQAVFLILARKAGTLRPDIILEAWLYQTTRLTSLSFLRGERRRQARDYEAYMQSTIQSSAGETTWNQIAPLLDEAVARLGKKDRDAVVLRFFKDKNLREVAAALNVTEAAAQSRVHRALDKLRHYFLKRGVDSTTAVLATTISAHSIRTAPAGLAKTISVVAVSKGAAAGGSTLALVKTTLIAMKTKTIVATVSTAVILAGISTWLATHHFYTPKAPDVSGIRFPIQLANANFHRGEQNQDPLFDVGFDPDTRRTSNSAPSIHIKGPNPPSPDLPPHFSDAALQKAGIASFTSIEFTNGSPMLGQHIRITGWLKCSNVKTWAAAYMAIWTQDKGWSRVDIMDDRDNRPILQGTMDWQQVEFITDVPEAPCAILVGPDLYGPGELWGDDFQISLADAKTPRTDDRNWRQTSADPGTYSHSTDFQTKHDGHPAICLVYGGDGPATNAWTWWGQKIRDPDVDQYVGHTVQWTGWVKTENVSRRVEPTIRPWEFDPSTAKSSIIAKDRLVGGRNGLNGTRDWTEFTVTCAIPDNAQHIDTAFIFYGSGKVWVDMDSLKLKIIK